MDTVDRKTRSAIMANVRSRDNKSTERRLRALLVQSGICGWKVQAMELEGKPDFAFPSRRLLVFVDSCFWHGCPRHLRLPNTRKGYWNSKIRRNKERDRAIRARLSASGWKVLRIWEHELSNPSRVLQKLNRLLDRGLPAILKPSACP